ncbi:hypothetical protein ODIN_85 [Mycobacterium phage Odin]|nr:hypothetical protein ODIN_85 [Mycobacterium phage Odin]
MEGRRVKKHLLTIAITFATTIGVLALADTEASATPHTTMTVDAVDYPVCDLEDCSDQPGQVGVWIDPDTGDHWLSVGEISYRVKR